MEVLNFFLALLMLYIYGYVEHCATADAATVKEKEEELLHLHDNEEEDLEDERMFKETEKCLQ